MEPQVGEMASQSSGRSTDPSSVVDLSGVQLPEVRNLRWWMLARQLESLRALIGRSVAEHSTPIRRIVYLLAGVGYNVYLMSAVCYATYNRIPLDWCDGTGLLLVLTAVTYAALIYFRIIKRFFSDAIYRAVGKPLERRRRQLWSSTPIKVLVYLALVGALGAFLVVDTADDRSRLISFLGLVVFVLLGFLFSRHPSKIIWRQVLWGIGLQFVLGLIVLRWSLGRHVIQCVSDKITRFLAFTRDGSAFVYGYLVTGNSAVPSVFAFSILSVIFFFSFCVSMLYYYGVMQWIVQKIGWLLHISVGTTAAESMNAAANIFLGQTEAPLVIRKYLPVMTKSELHAVMTGGFATIAGAVLAAYVEFGIDAADLLTASVMSAPAALAYSKLFYPETEESSTKSDDIGVHKGREANGLDAAAQGAANAVMLVLNIIANLIAFLAFVAFLDAVVSWMAGLVGAPDITFQWLLGKVFIPVAWLMGVPPSECQLVANLVALKSIVNEFAAYSKLSEYISQGLISKRSETIATYALCGFSNPGSIGIQIAGLSTMAPERKSDLAQVAFRAFVAGSVACFMTACIAGTLTSTAVPN